MRERGLRPAPAGMRQTAKHERGPSMRERGLSMRQTAKHSMRESQAQERQLTTRES